MKSRTEAITYVLGFLVTGLLLAGSLAAKQVDGNCCDGTIPGLAPDAAGLLGAGAEAGTIVLSFDGLGDLEVVGGFYAGGLGSEGSGPGPDFGITFSTNGLSIISIAAGGTGNFLNNPAGDTVLFFLEGTETVMNVPAGFQTGFSFAYSAAFEPGVVRVYDDVDGQGNVLAELDLPLTPSTGQTGFAFDNWAEIGVTFDGVARSVDFGGAEDQIGFDNITLGSDQVGGAPVQLELSEQVLSSPFLNDHFILYSVENIGDAETRNLILDVTVSEPAELAGIYVQAPSCAIEPRENEEDFICNLSDMDDWVCDLEGNFGNCQLDSLPPAVMASLIIHVSTEVFDTSLVDVRVQEQMFTVTALATPAEGGQISPSGEFEARFGEQLEFELIPEEGFVLESVEGTCDGELNELIFVAGPIVANCSITAVFGPLGFPTETIRHMSSSEVTNTCPRSGRVDWVPMQIDGNVVTADFRTWMVEPLPAKPTPYWQLSSHASGYGGGPDWIGDILPVANDWQSFTNASSVSGESDPALPPFADLLWAALDYESTGPYSGSMTFSHETVSLPDDGDVIPMMLRVVDEEFGTGQAVHIEYIQPPSWAYLVVDYTERFVFWFPGDRADCDPRVRRTASHDLDWVDVTYLSPEHIRLDLKVKETPVGNLSSEGLVPYLEFQAYGTVPIDGGIGNLVNRYATVTIQYDPDEGAWEKLVTRYDGEIFEQEVIEISPPSDFISVELDYEGLGLHEVDRSRWWVRYNQWAAFETQDQVVDFSGDLISGDLLQF